MPQLRFANRYKHSIIHGHKNGTVRLHGEHDVEANMSPEFVDEEGEVFALGYIPMVVTTTAQNAIAVMNNLNISHGAASTRALIRTLNGFYERTVTVSSLVDIIKFYVTEVHIE